MKLRQENEVFNNQMHQDAHELLNYLLNEMADILEKRNKRGEEQGGSSSDGPGAGRGAATSPRAAAAHRRAWVRRQSHRRRGPRR